MILTRGLAQSRGRAAAGTQFRSEQSLEKAARQEAVMCAKAETYIHIWDPLCQKKM